MLGFFIHLDHIAVGDLFWVIWAFLFEETKVQYCEMMLLRFSDLCIFQNAQQKEMV